MASRSPSFPFLRAPTPSHPLPSPPPCSFGLTHAMQARLGIGILPLAAARSFAHAMQLKVLPLSDDWSLRGMQICMRSRPAQQTPLGQLAQHLQAIAAGDDAQA